MLLDLFLSFLKIGMFSFGGGYAALPLIQNQTVLVHHWLSLSEFTNLITISQMTPGPIAINSATFVGTKVAGLPGAAAATLGCILPSCIVVTFLAWLYLKYRTLDSFQTILKTMRPVVIALIGAAGCTILISAFFGEAKAATFMNLHIEMVIIFMTCLYLLTKKRWNPVLVMLLSGGMNIIWMILSVLWI